MKKLNLQIDISTSQDETLSNFSNSSIFLNKDQVIFKKDGFIVDNKGVKSIHTGEALTQAIDPNQLEVNINLIKLIFILFLDWRLFRFRSFWECLFSNS